MGTLILGNPIIAQEVQDSDILFDRPHHIWSIGELTKDWWLKASAGMQDPQDYGVKIGVKQPGWLLGLSNARFAKDAKVAQTTGTMQKLIWKNHQLNPALHAQEHLGAQPLCSISWGMFLQLTACIESVHRVISWGLWFMHFFGLAWFWDIWGVPF